ncbi:MAG: hypothetical protein AB7F94_17485, partial [Nitrospira sp.]
MDTTGTSRVLTHDERKAAEAAFSRRPFNPTWSESAKRVYEGLVHALPALPDEPVLIPDQNAASNESSTETAPTLPTTEEPKLEGPIDTGKTLEARTDIPANQLITN